MVVQTVTGQLVALFLILIAGYLLRRRKIIDSKITKGCSGILVNAGMPAMVLASLQQAIEKTPFSTQRLRDMGMIFLGMLIMMALGALLCGALFLFRRVSLSEKGMWICAAAFFNAAFMARPLILALYGDEALFASTIIIFVFNLTAFSLGAFLCTLGEGGASLPRLLLGSLRNITMLACILGFVLFVLSWRLPSPALSALNMLSDITVPLSMLIIGSQLAQDSLIKLLGDVRVYLLCGIRLLAVPILSLLLLRLFVTDPLLLGALVLAGSMPTATVVAVFAEQHDSHSALASKMVFASTLFCVATVPLITWLMTTVL